VRRLLNSEEKIEIPFRKFCGNQDAFVTIIFKDTAKASSVKCVCYGVAQATL
jgi:hypothetical protein